MGRQEKKQTLTNRTCWNRHPLLVPEYYTIDNRIQHSTLTFLRADWVKTKIQQFPTAGEQVRMTKVHSKKGLGGSWGFLKKTLKKIVRISPPPVFGSVGSRMVGAQGSGGPFHVDHSALVDQAQASQLHITFGGIRVNKIHWGRFFVRKKAEVFLTMEMKQHEKITKVLENKVIS